MTAAVETDPVRRRAQSLFEYEVAELRRLVAEFGPPQRCSVTLLIIVLLLIDLEAGDRRRLLSELLTGLHLEPR